MKKFVILALLAIILAPVAQGQSHDLSAWFKMRNGETTVIPWYVYNGPVFIDARYNFDATDSVAVLVGKSFGKDTKFIPAIGGITGKYDSLTAELNIIGKAWIVEYFVMNQYSHGFGNSPNFVYHWTDLLVPLGKNILVGFDEQWYWQPGGKGELDYGPVVKLKSNDGLYVKGWLAATNTGPHKLFIGFGLSR